MVWLVDTSFAVQNGENPISISVFVVDYCGLLKLSSKALKIFPASTKFQYIHANSGTQSMDAT